MGEFRKRIVSPTLIPIVSTVFIAVLVFSFSRILLAVPEIGSTALALLISAEILFVAAILSFGRGLRSIQRALLLVVGVAVIAGGGAAAAIGTREIEKHGVEIEIATVPGLKFDKEQLVVPPETAVEMHFDNQDAGVPHNVSVYEDQEGTKPVFTGDIFNGVASKVYTLEPIPAGEYMFRCDVHPTTMIGTLIASEDAAGGHGAPEPGHASSPTPSASVSSSPVPSATQPGEQPGRAGTGPSSEDISATGTEFNKETLTLKAGSQVFITMTITDSLPHNISINSQQDFAGEEIFKGAIVTGPTTERYEFESPKVGTYYFRCDVHPTEMTGTVEFA